MSKMADYKIIKDSDGNRYRFFCELSGMAVHTTEPYREMSPELEAEKAWQNEGRSYFDKCHKCGRWVCGTMFNADVLQCVECAPWENKPNYCSSCGKKVSIADIYCSMCGKKLQYRKVDEDDS